MQRCFFVQKGLDLKNQSLHLNQQLFLMKCHRLFTWNQQKELYGNKDVLVTIPEKDNHLLLSLSLE